MAGMELLSDQGFRTDGRKPNELRRIRFKKGVFKQADGSAYLEQGNTKVLAAVYGPHEIRGSKGKALHDKLLINCQYSMATFSTQDRKRRPRGDRKSQEMTMHLKQTFNAVVLTELFPKVQLDIYVEVLQSDGGNYCASVNAATLALIDAGIPMKDYVIACSGSFVKDTPIVDINHLEESTAGAEIIVAVLPRFDQIVFIEMNSRLHEDHLSRVMDQVMNGCKDIFNILNQQVKDELCKKAAIDKLVDAG
ncbi:exosome complex component RRP41 [Biomphalaria glabrata]|uniref:Putative exosome complex component RRP41 n=1 Tax=Biomphalaria glabrata TaxID=6526 RepID=A0A2C9K718_BIOGL|nr:exosome complex component RRP41-like [Biomphalaria glabrata]KAI8762959.1 exosome complex component RRP41-like [Biomphalaria glabrata]KAI8790746.1 exosome complex component RRP41 [Biomphalaria glabrata]